MPGEGLYEIDRDNPYYDLDVNYPITAQWDSGYVSLGLPDNYKTIKSISGVAIVENGSAMFHLNIYTDFNDITVVHSMTIAVSANTPNFRIGIPKEATGKHFRFVLEDSEYREGYAGIANMRIHFHFNEQEII